MTEINSHKEGDIDPETVMLNINLQRLIEEIDVHFIRTLDMHEDDFKLAYRGQMLKVKRELQHLKNKVNELTAPVIHQLSKEKKPNKVTETHKQTEKKAEMHKTPEKS